MNQTLKKAAVLVLVLGGMLPMSARAQDTGPAAQMKAEVANDALAGLGRENLENRRQELVVANMKFSNDEQQAKFLEIYVPYQEKLMNNLKQRKKLLDDYQSTQENGVIGDSESTKLMNANLTLDRNRNIAESSYLHALKAIMPMEQALRAYQIEERLNAFYLNDILGTIHLVK